MKILLMTLVLAAMVCGCGDKRSVDPVIQESVDSAPLRSDLDNGLSSWNVPSSEFGQWCYKAVRIVKAPSGKYVPELNINLSRESTSTNAAPRWVSIFEGDGFTDMEICRYKIKQAFAIKKGIADAFQGLCSAIDTPKTVDIIIPAKTNMPPGYSLQKNQEGKYRPARERSGKPLIGLEQGVKTRRKAIAEAWGQYDYEHRDTTTGWEDVR